MCLLPYEFFLSFVWTGWLKAGVTSWLFVVSLVPTLPLRRGSPPQVWGSVFHAAPGSWLFIHPWLCFFWALAPSSLFLLPNACDLRLLFRLTASETVKMECLPGCSHFSKRSLCDCDAVRFGTGSLGRPAGPFFHTGQTSRFSFLCRLGWVW